MTGPPGSSLVLLASVVILSLGRAVRGVCVVESLRCSFPFSGSEDQGVVHYSCQSEKTGNESLDYETSGLHYCHAQVGERHVSGVCNSHCYEDEGVTPVVFTDDDPMAFFCKTEANECEFPFTWEGKTYNTCTTDGSEFAWCALQVDGERRLVGNRWGKCDMERCSATSAEATEVSSREARAIFSDMEVEGLILFSQESNMDALKIDGKVGGLDNTPSVFMKISSANCDNKASGQDLGGDDELEVVDNMTYISLEKWGVSLYPGQEMVVGGSVRLEVRECGETDCVERSITCANIESGGQAMDVNLILTVSLVVFTVLLVLLTVILIICCIRRFCPKRKRHDEVDSMGSIDDIFKDQRKTRSPLYDELSIPFIDASLPPTPKVGRGGNPLEILLGKIDGSRTSLNDTSKSGN